MRKRQTRQRSVNFIVIINIIVLSLFLGDNDVDMYSDSGDDSADGKPLNVDTREEQVDRKWDKKAKQMTANVNSVDAEDVSVSVEDEPMSDAQSEHNDQCYEVMDADDRALIKEEKPVGQTANEKGNHSLPLEQPPKLPKVTESSKEIVLFSVSCDEPLVFVWYHAHGTTSFLDCLPSLHLLCGCSCDQLLHVLSKFSGQ